MGRGQPFSSTVKAPTPDDKTSAPDRILEVEKRQCLAHIVKKSALKSFCVGKRIASRLLGMFIAS